MGTRTSILSLYKPADNENGWGDLVDANWDAIDTDSGVKSVAISTETSARTAADVVLQNQINSLVLGNGIEVRVDGTDLSSQTLINFQSGSDITLSNPSAGNLVVNFTGTLAASVSLVSHHWITSYDSSTGLFSTSQPGFSDVSGSLALSQIPLGGTSSTYLRGDGVWATVSGGSSTLASDTDVSFSGLLSNQFLQYNGVDWINHTLSYTDVSGLATVAHSGAYSDLSGTPALNFLPTTGGNLSGSLGLANHKGLYFDGVADFSWGMGFNPTDSGGWFTTTHVPGGAGNILKIVYGADGGTNTDGFAIGTTGNTSALEIDSSHNVFVMGALNVAGGSTFGSVTFQAGSIAVNALAHDTVALTDSTGLFTVSGSPATLGNGITLSAFALQSPNTVLRSGSGTPAFGALILSDLPTQVGTGSIVLQTSPTLITPNLGTPSAGVLTSCTFPTFNQNTTGTASNLSGTPALPNGTTATTQLAANNTTKLATTAYADSAVGVEVSRAETAETLLVPKTTTVNGHALSANVIVSATDITTGTLPHAQLPALVSADIPNNAANTSGTSANLSGTPALPNGVTATTQTALNNTTRLATTAYTDAAVGVETSRAGTAEALLVPKTTTVNGHALSGNVVVSATDISTGTLPAAQLPNPSAITLGGIQSLASVSHKYINAISTLGVPTASQPAAADITGLATVATTGAYSDLTGKPVLATAISAVSHNFLTSYNATTGAFAQVQPAFTDISGTATVGQIPSLSSLYLPIAGGNLTGNLVVEGTFEANNNVTLGSVIGVGTIPAVGAFGVGVVTAEFDAQNQIGPQNGVLISNAAAGFFQVSMYLVVTNKAIGFNGNAEELQLQVSFLDDTGNSNAIPSAILGDGSSIIETQALLSFVACFYHQGDADITYDVLQPNPPDVSGCTFSVYMIAQQLY